MHRHPLFAVANTSIPGGLDPLSAPCAYLIESIISHFVQKVDTKVDMEKIKALNYAG